MVKNKLHKRWAARAGALLSVLMILCSMIPHGFAVTEVDDETSYTELINIGRFDTVVILDSYQVPYAYTVIDDDGSTGPIEYSWYSEYNELEESAAWACNNPSPVRGAYRARQTIDSPGGNYQKVSFSSSQPFILTESEWNLLMECFSVRVPEGCDFTFTVSFTGYYPVEVPDGGFRWTRIEGTDAATYDDELSGAGNYTPVNYLSNIVGTSDFYSVFAKGIYCTELSFTVELWSEIAAIGHIEYYMPYQDAVNCVKPLDFFRQYPRESTTVTIVEDLNASNIGAFLATAAGGFFSLEIIPGLSLGGILAAIVGVLILLAFLKFR